ncbi:autotransporter domain-containing protein [Pollutimonas sp. M17]|uniref:autotransporter family protein n=1 Tax=Pollutimonas sp. M17 TaxID=2962065 RepID=UPI0021F4DE0E|nr:autotransporter domain-containing protein [Pollutimonas sp. M17]UYO93359.1 autotransporter domain-containing protein [Pollutimonas sp. M17]
MSGLNISRPAIALSALTAALLVVFSPAYAAGPGPNKVVVASGKDDVKLKHGTSYKYLEAKRGGEISGFKTSIQGQAGNLVNANSGGKIKLKGADIEASGHKYGQGPAVSATGDRDRGHHRRDSIVTLENGKITTNNANSPALQANKQGGKIHVDGTELRTRGSRSDVVQALDGGEVTLRRAEITSDGRYSDGIKVSGHGSTAIVDRTRISTRGDGADGVSVSKGGLATIDKSSVQTRGHSANGVSVSSKRSVVIGKSVDVSTKGNNAIGLDVEDGGKAFLVGSKVSASGNNGVALNVDGRGSQAIVLGSSLKSSGRNGRAILVEDGAQALIANSTVMAKGLGVEVRSKGKAQLIGSDVQAYGDRATGASVSGNDSSLSVVGTTIEATGDDSTGVQVSKGARALLINSEVQGRDKGIAVNKGARVGVIGGSIAATGSNGVALSVEDRGSVAAVIDADLTANGRSGVAVDVQDAGRAYLLGSRLNAKSVGVQADGKGTSVISIGSEIVAGSGEKTHRSHSASKPAVGVAATRGAEVILIGGEVAALGDKSVGALAAGGDIQIERAQISSSGSSSIAVLAQQEDRSGKHGRNRHVSSSQVEVNDSTVSATGNNAVAVKANGKRSEVSVEDSTVSATGRGSHAVVSQDGGKVILNNSTVNVEGKGSAVAVVTSEKSRRNREVSELHISGSDLTATGKQSAGIKLENSANVYLTHSTISTTGASFVSNLDRGHQTQNIVVGDGAKLVENNGTLLQVNRSGDSGNSKVNLDLQDGSVTAGNIVDDLGVTLSGSGGTYVKLGALATYDGKMTGVREVTTEGGKQKINFEGGSSIGNLSIDGKAVTSGGLIEQRIHAAQDVTVNDATLGGNWQIDGKLISKNGGIIKPGNSVGAISTASIDWQAGTVYQVEINKAGQSDLVEVTGAANIANTKLVVSEENGQGRFRLNHDYTVLTAAGGVDGQFTSSDWAGTAYPLISMNTLYSDNAVAVRMGVNHQALSTMGFTQNQRTTGFGAASVAGANATVDEAFFSPDPAQAFDQLSGEVHASARSLLFSDMLSTNAALQSHMRANLGAELQPGKPIAAVGDTPTGAQPKYNDYPLWVRFNAASIDMGGNDNAASARYSPTRLLVGVDKGLAGGWRLGAAAGISSGDFSVNARSSKGNINNYTFALYGGNSWRVGAGKLNLMLGGGYTRHTLDTNRHVSLGGGQKLSADYHGSTWQLFGDLGYVIPWGETHNVEPYVNISWFDQHMGSFSESGGDAALSSSATSAKLSSYTLGLRSALVFPGGTRAFTVRTNLGWRHAGEDRSPTRTMRFIEGAGSSFSVVGAPIAKNSLLVGLGGEVALDEYFAMGLSYNGEFGSGNSDNAGSLYVKVRF